MVTCLEARKRERAESAMVRIRAEGGNRFKKTQERRNWEMEYDKLQWNPCFFFFLLIGIGYKILARLILGTIDLIL